LYETFHVNFRQFVCLFVCLFLSLQSQVAMASSFTRFLDHTQRHTTVGRTPLISSSHTPLPDNTQHSQHTNIHAPGVIRTHSLSRRAALDRAATGTGLGILGCVNIEWRDGLDALETRRDGMCSF